MLTLFAAAALALAAQDPGYEWKPTDDPDQVALYQGGRQVGAWSHLGGYYRPLSGASWGAPCDPPAMPPYRPDTRFGVDESRVRDYTARHGGGYVYSLNGNVVSQQQGYRSAAGADGKLPDDSTAWSLTFIGEAEACKACRRDFDTYPSFAPVRARFVAQDYRPDDAMVRRSVPPSALVAGKVTVMVQEPGGKVRYRDAYPGPEALAGELRRVSPDYRPEADPGSGSVSNETAVFAAVAGLLVVAAFWRAHHPPEYPS